MELSLPLRLPRPRARRRHAVADLALEMLRARRLAARVLLCAVLALPALGGGWLWLRSSPLAAVRHVHIVGVHGPEATAVRDALDRAAEKMTTMRFSVSALRAAVADYPIVASVSARTSFPHSVSIAVSERPPVAVLVGPGERAAVAADGTVLGPALASAGLPTISVKTVPPPGAREREAPPLAAAAVLGAAPTRLLRYVARAYDGSEGLTLAMDNGLLVYFGDATLPHAKWLSLARVLGSPTASGAVYIDVRLPSRPAAGFTLSRPAEGAASAAATAAAGSADPAAAALAERLAQATGGAGSAAGATGGEQAGEGSGAAPPSAEGEGAASGETAGSGAGTLQSPQSGEAGAGASGEGEYGASGGTQASG